MASPKFILTFCIWLSAFGSIHTGNFTAKRKPLLNKCCQDNELYLIGLDTCLNKKASPRQLNRVMASSMARRNEQYRLVSFDTFDIKVNLSVCPQGTLAVSTTNFTLYEDGSLKSVTDEKDLSPGDFCLHESLPSEENTVRYCLEDHLSRLTRVHKCCPGGMAKVGDYCQPSRETFQPIYHYHNGTATNEEHPVISGVTPQCSGKQQVFLEQNDFYLLPEGLLFIKNSSLLLQNETWRETDEFCIENIVNNSTSKVIQTAVICTNVAHGRVFPPRNESEELIEEQKFYPYFMFVSAFFMTMTFIVYALLPEMRNIHGVPVMCYVACLAVSYTVYGVLQMVNTDITELCRVLAILVHFMYLSTYAWLNVVCFDIFWTLKKMRPTKCINQAVRQPTLGKTFVIYSSYAWVIPLLIVVVGQVLDHLNGLPEYIIKPMLNHNTCWFSDTKSVVVYVYTPVAVSVFFDILLVVLTGIQLHRAGFGFRGGNCKESSRYGYRLLVITALFALKVASWITEFIAVVLGYLAGDLLYVVDSIDMVASILTFVIFVCKLSVWEGLRDRCCNSCRSNLSTPKSGSKRIILNEMSSTPKDGRRNWVYDTSS